MKNQLGKSLLQRFFEKVEKTDALYVIIIERN